MAHNLDRHDIPQILIGFLAIVPIGIFSKSIKQLFGASAATVFLGALVSTGISSKVFELTPGGYLGSYGNQILAVFFALFAFVIHFAFGLIGFWVARIVRVPQWSANSRLLILISLFVLPAWHSYMSIERSAIAKRQHNADYPTYEQVEKSKGDPAETSLERAFENCESVLKNKLSKIISACKLEVLAKVLRNQVSIDACFEIHGKFGLSSDRDLEVYLAEQKGAGSAVERALLSCIGKNHARELPFPERSKICQRLSPEKYIQDACHMGLHLFEEPAGNFHCEEMFHSKGFLRFCQILKEKKREPDASKLNDICYRDSPPYGETQRECVYAKIILLGDRNLCTSRLIRFPDQEECLWVFDHRELMVFSK